MVKLTLDMFPTIGEYANPKNAAEHVSKAYVLAQAYKKENGIQLWELWSAQHNRSLRASIKINEELIDVDGTEKRLLAYKYVFAFWVNNNQLLSLPKFLKKIDQENKKNLMRERAYLFKLVENPVLPSDAKFTEKSFNELMEKLQLPLNKDD